GDPRLRKMVEHLSDDELRGLSRGGHDYRKVYAAFKAAREHIGQPTVILAHTIKGWTLGKDFEARNATHQMKKLTVAELKEFRDRLYLPIPDEARTFGMDSLFPTAKIYSPSGQSYDAVDRNLLLSYKESETGQILHEGISESGAMGSVIAAGSSYATHGTHMIPVYVFYSMFGWQRTGDQMWALGDQLGRGFLLGATAGRTTLAGEGLQHNDGHSPLLASVSEACITYDPAWAYEISYIVEDALRRMYGSN